MYYVTFSVPDDTYCVAVKARSAKHAISLVCKGKRKLVCVTLTAPTNYLTHLSQYS